MGEASWRFADTQNSHSHRRQPAARFRNRFPKSNLVRLWETFSIQLQVRDDSDRNEIRTEAPSRLELNRERPAFHRYPRN